MTGAKKTTPVERLDAGRTYIAPSLLSADFARLAEEIRAVEEAGADLIHVDVMDGHFVPNLTVGPPVVKAIRKAAHRPLDVHLMIESPERYVSAFAEAGARVITVHAEACPNLHRVLAQIAESGCLPGVSINPATPVDGLKHVLDLAELVLVMTVNPGFGGQRFIAAGVEKVAALRRMREQGGWSFSIEVDGGIDPRTIGAVASAGANVFVAGSAVFGQEDYAKAIRALREGLKGLAA